MHSPHHRHRILWATLTFMAGFAVLIVVVSHWYLLPALEATQGATRAEKRQLAATSRLLLALILFVLVAGLLLTFRVGRYFVPRLGEKAKPTKYVDAWAESAKRVSVPPREHPDDDDDEQRH